MKCEDVSKDLIAYLDRRSNSADRVEIEHHLLTCAGCRARAAEFRALWGMLDAMPAVEPSLGFDARVRQRVAAAGGRGWRGWVLLQPRLAFALAILLGASVWMAKPPSAQPGDMASGARSFEAIRDLNVLENYDVLTKFDALSELVPAGLPQASAQPADDSGGS
ncbi:MAG TPA: zf-HC2 domain-containing protein [Candidatus Acidoferrales bacterium]|nr:zf-HC2 domain-containing protein [Candidatus Acidoferrales bacterium]